jgi:hypothetical protein
MALYYNLPIYKASYRLVFILFTNSSNFSREYKYTVGQKLKDEGLLLIKNLYRANKAIDKLESISEARENLEMIRLFLRLMQDLDQLSLKKFVEISLVAEEVSKQLVLWEKYNKKVSCKPEKEGIATPESSVARAQASVRKQIQ